MTARDTRNTAGNHTANEGINNTRLNRLIVISWIKLLKRWCPRQSRVLFLPCGLCIKYGKNVRLTEALAMKFVGEHSTIPVPHVYCAFTGKEASYIVMKRLSGTALGQNWSQRNAASRAKILCQLRAIVGELRDIRRGPGTQSVAAVDGGALFDLRLPGPDGLLGPFRTVREFHEYLRSSTTLGPSVNLEIQKLIVLNEETITDTCFTHGDLSSLNVLAYGDTITGLVDWEHAAWLPLYWEYVSSWHANPQNKFWQDEVEKFLDTFPRELEMEQLRRKYFGDY